MWHFKFCRKCGEGFRTKERYAHVCSNCRVDRKDFKFNFEKHEEHIKLRQKLLKDFDVSLGVGRKNN